MSQFYRADLAHIHDAGFGFLASNAAPVLLAALRAQQIHQGLVLDLGCGSGILSEQLVAAGYAVLGIDLSEDMVALARQRVPTATFRVGSVLNAELPPCVAVTAVGEIFNYLFDQGNTRQALVKLFRRIHTALQPGGFLLFDVAGPGRVAQAGPQQRYVTGDGWVVLVTAEEKQSLLTRRIISFRQEGELYRRADEVHQLRLYPRGQVARDLRRLQFRVRVLSRYGTFPLPPGLAGFLARKP